jgi:hypothetical protein
MVEERVGALVDGPEENIQTGAQIFFKCKTRGKRR